MKFIDTHSHLFSEEFDEDIDLVIKKCSENGVYKVLLPNVDATTVNRLHNLIEKYPDICLPMMGLHPCSVTNDFEKDLENIKNNFNSRKYVGVGEVGIDLYWDKSTEEIQNQAFLTQCQWAFNLNLPLSIHTRNATYHTIKLIKSLSEKPTGVFHCFGGSLEEANEIIKLGYKLGIGGVVTFKNSNLPQILKEIGLQHLVLETDSPYLAPTPHRGKRNESTFIPLIAEKLAEIYNTSLQQIADTTTENALRIFKNLNI